jgi:syntaxin 5
MCDRTDEFFSIIQSTGKSAGGAGSLPSRRSSGQTDVKGKNVFHDAASEIAKGVHKTSTMLAKLTTLVRKQGLFDDPTEEINTLIYRIKQDLDELNNKCDTAQQFADTKKSFFGSSASQSAQHNVKVVSSLKSELMNTTRDFKGVLELRSFKMKDQQQRKVELTGRGQLSALNSLKNPNQASSSSSSLSSAAVPSSASANNNNELVHRHRNPLPSPYATADERESRQFAAASGDEEHHHLLQRDNQRPHQQQQQLLLEPIAASQYFDAREQAVTEVEKTIGELGSLFKRLATMLHEQQELVERIDEDVENAVTNTDNAKNQLLKAFESAASNRGMMMKIGGILAIFILFFILFMM